MTNAEKQSTILVVDDSSQNIELWHELLRNDYKVRAALNGERALKLMAGDDKPDLVLLDIMMPGMSGYEVCEKLKADPTTRNIPIIFVTAKSQLTDEVKGFELGAVDYVTKPIQPVVVMQRIRTHLALYDQSVELERQVRQRTSELQDSRLQIVQSLGKAAEYKDNETGMHVVRMSHYSQLLALKSGLDEYTAELLLHAAPMHDVGKIGIPDHILQKPGKLDDAEWAIMKTHPQIGSEILGNSDSELMKMAREVALNHHEKYDGSGYPAGKAGKDIPYIARIVTIADVFDALTSVRPYKEAWSAEKAFDLLKDERGSHFDPDLVDLFLRLKDEVLAIKAKYLD